MDDKAKETADWLVRVLNEAEPLPVSTNLDIHQQAYLLASDGMPRRKLLFHFANEIFFTSMVADSQPYEFIHGAGHEVTGIAR